jgi:hypothetical protein
MQRLSENIGDYLALTATGGSTTTVVDTALANYTEDNGGIQGWVYIDDTTDDAAPEGEIRRIKNGASGYTASSKTITVNFAFTAGVASSDTYQLHRFDPVVKRDAINRALEELFPTLYLPIRNMTVMIDNILGNSAFEYFSGGFSSWTEVGSPTVTQETGIARIKYGNSAKIIASGAIGQLTQQGNPSNLSAVTDRTARQKFWAFATTVNSVRIRIDFDGGTTFANSDYHTGAAQWELLEASDDVPGDASTQVKTILEVADGNTGYFGPGYLALGHINKYGVDGSIVHGPHFVDQQASEDTPEGPYVPLRRGIEGRLLRLRGMGVLSRPTSDTGTTEIDGIRINLVVAKAAEILFQRTKGNPNDERHSVDFWRTEVARLENRPGIRMAPMAARDSGGFYHFEEDSDGNHIILDQ